MAACLDPYCRVCSESVVTKRPSSSPIDSAAAQLRTMSLDAEDGALLGGEDVLVTKLGVSRATLRQAARLLEREGLLRVRRGINGGYFAARPNERTIETAVSAYLDTLDMDTDDVMVVASVLWVEAVRKAASLRTEAVRDMARSHLSLIAALPLDAPFSVVAKLESETRTALFDMIKGRYIELIFQINIAFAHRRFTPNTALDGTPTHQQFVQDWRAAKTMECQAIVDGDPELAMMAARHSRNVLRKRILAETAQTPRTRSRK
jgi:DNA-binding FadR family transcriptional regulator